MLFDLLKKQFQLVKKYLLVLIIFAVGTPVYIIANVDSVDRGFWGFFITVLFLEYVLFNLVARLEEKNKDSALSCTTPYSINVLVGAKYLLVFMIFIFTYIIYTVTALTAHLGMEGFYLLYFGVSLLIITIYFAIVIPLQYRFGYEKTRFISFAIVFIVPFAAPVTAKWFFFNNIVHQIKMPYPQVIQNMFPSILALLIGLISMFLSIRIYSKKNLV